MVLGYEIFLGKENVFVMGKENEKCHHDNKANGILMIIYDHCLMEEGEEQQSNHYDDESVNESEKVYYDHIMEDEVVVGIYHEEVMVHDGDKVVGICHGDKVIDYDYVHKNVYLNNKDWVIYDDEVIYRNAMMNLVHYVPTNIYIYI